MPAWVYSLVPILGLLLALGFLLTGLYAFWNPPTRSPSSNHPEKYKFFGITIETRGGATFLIIVGLILLLFFTSMFLLEKDRANLQGKVSALESQIATLETSQSILASRGKEMEEIRGKLDSVVASSRSVPNIINRKLQSGFEAMPSAEDIQNLEKQIRLVEQNTQGLPGMESQQLEIDDRLGALEKQVDSTAKEVSGLSEDFWVIGDRILQPKVEEIAKKHLRSLRSEWKKEVARRKQTRTEPPPGQSIFPPGVTTGPSEPKIEARIENGIIIIDGLVPSPAAKESIAQAMWRLRPGGVKNNLQIKPW